MSATNGIRVAVVVSDIHAGSTVGLLPPDFISAEENEIKQNSIQQWLWACWNDGQKWIDGIVGKDAFALIVNGDVIEGNHHRTTQIITPKKEDHCAAAIDILRPLANRAAKRFFVRGTECHVGDSEINIARALGGEINADLKIPIWDRLTIDIAGTRCVFRHHIGTSTRASLEATQLSINPVEEIAEAIKNGERPPQVIGCAHRHKFGEFSNGRWLCFVTPPWQALTRFGHKVVSQARTQPGFVILDWRERPDGALPRVHNIEYNAPAGKVVTL